MKTSNILAFIAAAAVLLTAAPDQTKGAQKNKNNCLNVRGTAAGHSTSPTSFVSTWTGGLAGTAIGENFQITKAGEDGTLHFVVDHIIITDQGELYARGEGVLSPISPPIYLANERNTITGGTGAYVGATGRFELQAPLDFSTGEFTLWYHGQVCTQE